MVRHKTDDLTGNPKPASELPEKKKRLLLFSQDPPDVNHPSLIHFSSTPLFRLEQYPEKYVHLLKKKDHQHIGPIVNYFIGKSGHVVYLGGDAVMNLYLRGRKKYRSLNILAILTGSDLDNYTSILNNIISSNDGVFSMGQKYTVRKNRNSGCFKDIALARYVIEPRLEGPEKLLYPFRSSPIELDLTTEQRFTQAFMLVEKS
jgi:hypothetical protein